MTNLHTRIYKAAEKHARKYGATDGGRVDPKDFAQDVMVWVLENDIKENHSVFMKHRFADYMRKTLGKNGSYKQRGTRPAEYNDELYSRALFKWHERLFLEKRYLNGYFRSVKPLSRVLYLLFYGQDYSMKDLAELLGVTASRISSILKETQEQIDRNVKVLSMPVGRPKKKVD